MLDNALKAFQFLADIHKEQNAIVLECSILTVENNAYYSSHYGFFFEIDDLEFAPLVQRNEHQNFDVLVENFDVFDSQKVVQGFDDF